MKKATPNQHGNHVLENLGANTLQSNAQFLAVDSGRCAINIVNTMRYTKAVTTRPTGATFGLAIEYIRGQQS